MSRPVLAPLVVALSALLVVPQVQGEPTAPLFVVEQQRAALVTRLAKQWSDAFAVLPKERRLDHEQLSSALFALRADRLFAVTLAGDAETIEAVLVEAKREAAKPRVPAKALGDPLADLTYTPINPCRILDTRNTPVGPLAPGVPRTFDGYSADFSTQGGAASWCGVPPGTAALALNVYAVDPTNLGFIKLWPSNGAEPDVSTVNYQVGITALATGTLLAVDSANSNRFIAKSPSTVHLIADVTGYFKPPGDAYGLDIKVAGQRVMRYLYNAISPNVIGGHPDNSIGPGIRGATIAGGGVALGDTDPNFDGEGPNRVTGQYGTVGGGYGNFAGSNHPLSWSPFATVGGGYKNSAIGWSSTVCGGENNVAGLGGSNTVVGGRSNQALDSNSTVGGGALNVASGVGSMVGGGALNVSSSANTVVGGGNENRASGGHSTVGGGDHNSATDWMSTVGGGYYNVASGRGATISGGGVRCYGTDCTGLGNEGNVASGASSVVPGGIANQAGGWYSFAAGRRAKVRDVSAVGGGDYDGDEGAFLWSDASDFDFSSIGPNEFAARATGGVRFVTAVDGTGLPTWTCVVSGGAGGSWGCSSDRNLKTELIQLDGAATLERLAALPVYQWVAKDDPRRTPHAGPTAQDFMAAFGLGDNDKMIGFADAQGVAFAAIQGVNAKLEARLAEKDREIAELKRAVELLLARTSPEGRMAAGR